MKNTSPLIAPEKELNLITCHECGYQSHLPALTNKHKAVCPRCGFRITAYREHAIQWVCALAFAALIFLLIAMPYEFLSFSAGGQSQKINILGSIELLFAQDYALLGAVMAISILVLPACILLTILIVFVPLQFGIILPNAKKMVDVIFALLPWAMAEIFLVGVLVSLVKISSMADVGIGMSFYAFLLFTLSMSAMLLYLDEHQVRLAINSHQHANQSPPNASRSIQTTWALLLTSVLLYIPANLLPIMVTNTLGNEQPSTIIGGVILLWQSGSYPIAFIIFIASILVPVAKIVILSWLNFSVQFKQQELHRERIRWYRFTEFIGRWSMIDVFVVAVLVSLIQLGNVMTIHPGHAILAFCGVVIATMLAAMSFDTRLIWPREVPLNE
jgi:paraquat-inducible protein A